MEDDFLKIEKCIKESFAVIGKQGSTLDGIGFVQNLWEQANANFIEVQNLVKKDEQGNIVGFWGAMSDLSFSFQPWEDDFSKGYYLAGAECINDAAAPEGWIKWIIPSYEYLYVECNETDTFRKMLKYLNINDISLAGAVHDFTCPRTGKNYMYFPIKKI